MFKSLAIYIGKKYAISAVNDLLDEHKEDVTKVTSTINLWIERLNKVIDQLKRINDRVADNKIEQDEVNDSINEITELIKSF